ncbi:hypothetical protein K1719_019622 [Acacia pycnantha]|nr:hypothetical protein K1719_023358 [Acacia pycnantha]KAI9109568.1 hypothetical protein K1719_019622 [Acacia pycnantha]
MVAQDKQKLEVFSKWLLDLGDGKLGLPHDGIADVEILEELLIYYFEDSIHAIVSATYPNLLENPNVIAFVISVGPLEEYRVGFEVKNKMRGMVADESILKNTKKVKVVESDDQEVEVSISHKKTVDENSKSGAVVPSSPSKTYAKPIKSIKQENM